MANRIKITATLTPTTAAMEASWDSGTTYAPITMSTVNGEQVGYLETVPAATYAIGSVKLRAVGYPAVMVSNPAAFTVAAAATGLKRMLVAVGDSITEGFGLGAAYQSVCWPPKFAQLASANYGLVVNKGVSGNTTAQMVARIADIKTSFNLVDYAGVDVIILGGVNNFGASGTADSVHADYNTLATQFKAVDPAKVQVYFLTLPATKGYYTLNGSAALDAAVTAKINDNNVFIRANASGSLSGTGFIDLARRVEMQSPDSTAYFSDGLHPNEAGHGIIADTVRNLLVNSVQPTGPILLNATTPPSPTYVENPTEAQLAWVNAPMAPFPGDPIQILSPVSGGTRVQTTAYDGGVNAAARTTNAAHEVTTNWVMESEYTVMDNTEWVAGPSEGDVSAFGNIRYGIYRQSSGNVMFFASGNSATPTTGGVFGGVVIGNIIRVRVTKTTIYWYLDGVEKASFARNETYPLRATISMAGDPGSGIGTVAIRWRAWEYQAPIV